MALPVTPGSGANLKSNLDGSDHVVVHSEDTTQRAALLAALAALDPDTGLAAIVTALGQTLAISAAALPLPTGAATQATLASILAKLISAPATEAKQDATNTALGTLATQATAAAILAKLTADPATQTTLAAVLAKLSADPASQTTLAAILAKMIAAPATEAKQDALKASVDALLAATRPVTGHFLVVPSASALTNSTRRIVAGAAGTLTCVVGGTSVSYTVTAGQTLDVVATVISAAPAGTVGQF